MAEPFAGGGGVPFGWHDAHIVLAVSVELTGATMNAHGKLAGDGAGTIFSGFGFGGAVGSGAGCPNQKAARTTAATGFMSR